MIFRIAQASDLVVRGLALISLLPFGYCAMFVMGFAEGKPSVVGIDPVAAGLLIAIVGGAVLTSGMMPSGFTPESWGAKSRWALNAAMRVPAYAAVVSAFLILPQTLQVFDAILRFTSFKLNLA
ncbi:hypothetical protein [Acidihalobacter aeolianus]|uniref:hypothetical protein n=1 Tax=Acidihalobacter aeolianus TaxID=2792603 RepID=UPI0012EA52C8|nr:hypothetical protein [Acidihalobacter aeolianus]